MYDTKSLEIKLTKCTENITHCISEVWQCIQSPNRSEGCVQGADKIRTAVSELISIIPHVSLYILSL